MTKAVSEPFARAYLEWAKNDANIANAQKFLDDMAKNIKEQDLPTAEALLSKARIVAKTPARALPAVSPTAKPPERVAMRSPSLPHSVHRSKGVYRGQS